MKAGLTLLPDATLFLDRDGVINIEKQGDYIRHVAEFVLYDGVPEALSLLTKKFARILVVTNQRGIGRGLMTANDLDAIHQHLSELAEKAGAKIDAYYFAPDADKEAINRKPNTGMALQAKRDFPGIDFANSVMVGNNLSDMQFGKRMGMQTVFLRTTHPSQQPDTVIDHFYDSLLDFAKNIC